MVLWGSILPWASFAQSDNTIVSQERPLQLDSSHVAVQSFDSATIAAYRANPQFQYDERVMGLSWWDRFKLWLHQKWHDLLAASNSGRLLDYALATLGAIALVYLVVKLLGMDKGYVFSRRSQKTALQHTELDENIHTLDFDSELRQAVNQYNYRLAIRLLYLQSLKSLTDRGLIDWQPAKTNADYLRELDNGPHSQRFKMLTYQFEHSWYGDLPVDQTHFDTILADFEQFESEVHA